MIDRGCVAASTPVLIPISSHSTAPPTVSEMVTPMRLPMRLLTGSEL